jgi:hypothetical protein
MARTRDWLPLMLTALLAGAANAGEWNGHPTPKGGYQVIFGDDDAESALFQAWCDTPGADIRLWYLTERETFAGQERAGNGLREHLEALSIALRVDGTVFPYRNAKAQPEEMYGGNEITWATHASDPLFQALADGMSLSLVVEGEESDWISLRGSSRPFSSFRSHCEE